MELSGHRDYPQGSGSATLPDQMGEGEREVGTGRPQLGPGKVRDRWKGSRGKRENKELPPAEGLSFLGGECGDEFVQRKGVSLFPHSNGKKGEAGAHLIESPCPQ